MFFCVQPDKYLHLMESLPAHNLYASLLKAVRQTTDPEQMVTCSRPQKRVTACLLSITPLEIHASGSILKGTYSSGSTILSFHTVLYIFSFMLPNRCKTLSFQHFKCPFASSQLNCPPRLFSAWSVNFPNDNCK